MKIFAYQEMSDRDLNAIRMTSEGKAYTLNHSEALIVNMRYKGLDTSSSNAQGWERNSSYYFKHVQEQHPEFFSKKNAIRIENGESPRVDSQFLKHCPEYKGYENEMLIHHHVGGDGQAVAVPQSIHKGFGEIHIHENELGITDKARSFSDHCREICEKNPSQYNQTSDQFKESVRENAFTCEKHHVQRAEVSQEHSIDQLQDHWR